jgi:hypothetical protein
MLAKTVDDEILKTSLTKYRQLGMNHHHALTRQDQRRHVHDRLMSQFDNESAQNSREISFHVWEQICISVKEALVGNRN